MISVSPHSPQRFTLAIAISVVANFALWFSLSQLSTRVVAYRPPAVLEFSRVTIDKKGRKIEKIVKPVEIKRKKETVKPRLVEPKKVVQPVRQPQKPPPPQQQGAHNKVLTIKSPNPAPDDHSFTAPDDGKAAVGAPTIQQQGDGRTNVPNPTSTPPVQPAPASPVKQDTPPPAQTAPPPVKQEPPPPAPVKPTGPSRDADATYKVNPTIPDSLLSQDFKKSVRVRVHIQPDGTFTVELRQTCGNADVDKLAMDALKRWKWSPKLVDGVPTEDTQTFRFEFEVK